MSEQGGAGQGGALARWLPIVDTLRGYDRASARGDLVAGLTVGVMLVPQSMAYAVIADVPPIYGLYASIVPLLLYPLFGSSRQLAGGPIAIDMLLVAAGVGAVAAAIPGADPIALTIALSLMTGLVHLGMWALRLGFVASLLSRPVVTGFTGAAGLLIASSQLGNLFGFDVARSSALPGVLSSLIGGIHNTNAAALGMGLAGIALMVGLKRWAPRVPRALVLMVLATGASWAMGMEASGLVEVVGPIPAGLPPVGAPELDLDVALALLPAAITLAIVQFMDTISLARAFASRNGYAIDPSRELLALGVVNVGGSFASSIPTSASFSRSAVNEQSGAVTALSNLPAAGVVALSLLVLTPVVRHVPSPALAAIIIASCFGLLDLAAFRRLWSIQRREGLEALIAFGATLAIGIQQGLILGVGASMLFLLYRLGRPRLSELGFVTGEHRWRDLARHERAVRLERLVALRVEAPLSFANAEYLKASILERASGRTPDRVLLDVSAVSQLDATAADSLADVSRGLARRGIELHLCGVIGQVYDVLERAGALDVIPPERIWADLHDASVHLVGDLDVHRVEEE